MNLRKAILSMVIMLTCSFLLCAEPVRLKGIRLEQPDGTCFIADIYGDEFIRIMTTCDGEPIIQDKDGFWCYAVYDTDGNKSSTGIHAGSRTGTKAPSSGIPFDRIFAGAAERKSVLRNVPSSGKCLGQTEKVLVIPAEFKDIPFTYRKNELADLIVKKGYSYNGASGSVSDYFYDQFGDSHRIEFTISDIVSLPYNRAYYGENDGDKVDKRIGEMVRDACCAADDDTDFSEFDCDGDGIVDHLLILYSGGSESEGAGDDCIWPQFWYLKKGAGISLSLDGRTIDQFSCAAELKMTAQGNDFTIATIGTICHELCHSFGLPDMYDTDYEKSGGEAEALWGTLSLMDGGNANNNGRTPPFLTSIEREILGIWNPKDIGKGRQTLRPVNENGDCLVLRAPDNEDEYYLFECRSNLSWDRKTGGEGLVVYHIDKSDNDAGYSESYSRNLTAAQRWNCICNEINCRPDRQCADLVEALPDASAVSEAFFPNSRNNSLTPSGKTPVVFWDGTKSDIKITNISITTDGSVEMYVSVQGDDDNIPEADSLHTEIYQDAAIISWQSSMDYSGPSYILWGNSNGEKTEHEVMQYEDGRYAVVLEGLNPKTAYSVELYFKIDGVIGKKVSDNFTTKSVPSSYAYPYIMLKYVKRNENGTFPPGCKLPLRLFNASDAENIVWTYSGRAVTAGRNGYFCPEVSGELKATAIFPDGRKEIVTKQISIE